VPYQVDFDPQAIADLKQMRAYDRTAVLDTIERILSSTPTHVGKTLIKRLQGLDSPEYRLRVGDHRVFYDVSDQDVYILRILTKAKVDEYLREMGYEA
jgi:mRNA-degrading endonuclease RelE of RelBE toxin-antitoxin system